jgi:phosphohistidine phosphatase
VELYLFRHGEAGKRLPLSSKDQDRALTAEGREDVEAAGKALAKMGVKFDVVAASPLKRAKDTATILNIALRRREPVEEWDELKPEGSKNAFYRRLAKIRVNSSVLCVGHEPYLTTAIGEITGMGGDGSAGFRIVLKKAGMARVRILGFSPRIRGELRSLLTPRQVRNLT